MTATVGAETAGVGYAITGHRHNENVDLSKCPRKMSLDMKRWVNKDPHIDSDPWIDPKEANNDRSQHKNGSQDYVARRQTCIQR